MKLFLHPWILLFTKKSTKTNFIGEECLCFCQIFVKMARSVKFKSIIQSPGEISHLLIAITIFTKLQRIFYVFYPNREISQGRFDHIIYFNWSKLNSRSTLRVGSHELSWFILAKIPAVNRTGIFFAKKWQICQVTLQGQTRPEIGKLIS